MNTEVIDKLRLLLDEVVVSEDLKEADADAEFESLNVDSLDTFDFFMKVQENFDVEVPDGDEQLYDTLRKLAAFIEVKSG